MKKIINLGLALGFLFCASTASAEAGIQARVTGLETHTSRHGNAAAQNTASAYVDVTLAGGCTSLWFPLANSASVDSNSGTLSVLMSALLAGKSVFVYYRNEATSPWGDVHSCAISTVKILGS